MDITIFLAWIGHQDDATKTEVINLINQDNDSLYQTISSDIDFDLSDSDIELLSQLFFDCVVEDYNLFDQLDCDSEYETVWRACSSKSLGIHFIYWYEGGYVDVFESWDKFDKEVKDLYGGVQD